MIYEEKCKIAKPTEKLIWSALSEFPRNVVYVYDIFRVEKIRQTPTMSTNSRFSPSNLETPREKGRLHFKKDAAFCNLSGIASAQSGSKREARLRDLRKSICCVFLLLL